MKRILSLGRCTFGEGRAPTAAGVEENVTRGARGSPLRVAIWTVPIPVMVALALGRVITHGQTPQAAGGSWLRWVRLC